MAGNVVVLKNYQLTKEPGEHLRLVCMTGEKRGEVYYMRSNRIVLGRSDTADIKVKDTKSSREHAEIVNVSGDVFISDLGSNNGLYLNGNLVKQGKLKNKDRIIIGKTVYKFEIIEVEEKQEVQPWEKPKADEFSSGISQEFGSSEDDETQKKTKSKALLIIGGAILALIFLGDEEKKPKKQVGNGPLVTGRDISDEFERAQKAAYSKREEKVRKNLEIRMSEGIRELRERNYFRAISKFDLALIISPQNSRALAYKERAKKALDDDIEAYFRLGQKYEESYNLEFAIKNYCSILNLLQDYPEDDRYIQSENIIKELRERMGDTERADLCK